MMEPTNLVRCDDRFKEACEEHAGPLCFYCCGKGPVSGLERIPGKTREYVWHYRPREKYRFPPYNEVDSEEIFQVNLCDDCNAIAANCTIIGWDWWDAYDCIAFIIEDLRKVEKSVP